MSKYGCQRQRWVQGRHAASAPRDGTVLFGSDVQGPVEKMGWQTKQHEFIVTNGRPQARLLINPRAMSSLGGIRHLLSGRQKKSMACGSAAAVR